MEESLIYEVLESLGFSKHEIMVYIDLIRVGKSSVMDISKRTIIHRSNVYDVLETLVKKGVVNEIFENKRKIFYPLEPKWFLEHFKRKEEELKKIIPQIESIRNRPKEEKKVVITEGLNSIKSILMHFLDAKSPIAIYGTSKEALETFGFFLKEFNGLRIKKKIPMRHILGADSLRRVRELNSMNYTEARYFPSSYNSRISTNICGNTVVLIIWDTPVSAILIENKYVAETYRNYFEILWESAKVTF